MGHCVGGVGAWVFWQYGIQSNVVNDTTHNISLALVDSVEAAVPPDSITGVDDGSNSLSVSSKDRVVGCRVELCVLNMRQERP